MSVIAYENSKGTNIILNSGHYFCSEQTLRSFKWNYTYNVLPSNRGGSVSSFYKGENGISWTIAIFGENTEIQDYVDALANLFEYDVRVRTPGKLWIDNQYINVYVTEGQIMHMAFNKTQVVKSYTILPTNPFWCTEEKVSFTIGSGKSSSEGVKRYNNRYPYKYGTGYSSQTIYNTSEVWDTPAVITIYGAVNNPEIQIAGHRYKVNVQVLANERIIINQIDKTIYKIGSSGTKTNIFHYRDRENDIFQYIPAGAANVVYSGDFGFDVTLMHQRSEPYWT